MARRLLAQGVAVQVCDIDTDKTQALQALGARVAACPAHLGDVAHFFIVCVKIACV
jgi:3-hydroxyisobutyrate dehydrogenase-like beta-hydroxyacid dehydrogenase